MKKYWMQCQRTGRKTLSTDMRFETRSGLWVHKDSWEPEHPQDVVKSKAENTANIPSFPPRAQTVVTTAIIDFCNDC